MKAGHRLLLTSFSLALLLPAGCANREDLARFTIDGEPSLGWVVPAGVSVSFDPDFSETGNGSLRVDYDGAAAVSVPLFETTEVNVDDCMLEYSLLMASEGLKKPAYAEMTCRVDKNWYFSRALKQALIASMPWKKVRTPFFLQAGQAPDRIRLGVRFEGAGSVWVDGVHLYRRASRLLSFEAVLGSIFGVLAGLWGGSAGILSSKGRGRAFILGSGIALAVGSGLMLLAGVFLVIVKADRSFWYPLLLVGGIGVFVITPLIPGVRKQYERSEERRMRAADI
ncbi:MAG: hypothetical protein KJ626_05695 [Verrucomicrobia bacterium]|nr:hypothetical protein [Verrucomicrobiota bacterium]